ncbi:hypothetical protein [Streptomyces albovinaceus]|uniref:hypothetical protein n=1 Tax=Streptomyces albovinaceus TaxID=66867 RepID=UPI003CC60500
MTGKPSGDDIREGKPTYLLAVARTWAEAAGDEETLAVLSRVTCKADLTENDPPRRSSGTSPARASRSPPRGSTGSR